MIETLLAVCLIQVPYTHVSMSSGDCKQVTPDTCKLSDDELSVVAGPDREVCELRCEIAVPHSLVLDVFWTAGLAYFNGSIEISGRVREAATIEISWFVFDVTTGDSELVFHDQVEPDRSPMFILFPGPGIEILDTETLVGKVTLRGGDSTEIRFYGLQFFFES